jgi:hypothetical protein
MHSAGGDHFRVHGDRVNREFKFVVVLLGVVEEAKRLAHTWVEQDRKVQDNSTSQGRALAEDMKESVV